PCKFEIVPSWGAALLRPQARARLVERWGVIVARAIVAIAISVTVVAVAIVTVTGVITIPAAAIVVAPVAGPFTPFAVAAVYDFEVGAAAAINPDAVAVIAPSAVEETIGFAALANDENTVARVNGAGLAIHVIGGAIDQGGGF